MDVFVSEPRLDHLHLASAVNDAQDLLRYAGQAGIAVPQDVVAALVHAKGCVDSGFVPEETAVAFHLAVTALAAKVAPVTIETLHTSDQKTRRSLQWHGVLSFVLAVVVVLLSGLSFVATSMSKDIETSITQGNELAVELRNQVGPPNPGSVRDADCAPATAAPDPPIPFKDEMRLITELQDFSATIRTMLRTASKLDVFVDGWERSPLGTGEWGNTARARLQLEADLLNMRQEAFCKIGTYQDVRNFAQNVHADAVAVYGAMSAYLLPVLYALLGACAYNLRDFSARVKRRTYHASSYANTARTIAALTIGTIISLFNVFSRDSALQPFAVAFLAGYGVEVFFAFLDSLLAAFKARGQPEARGAPVPRAA
jgi:hypothetical protein